MQYERELSSIGRANDLDQSHSSVHQMRQQKLDRQRKLLEQRNRQRRMQTGMVISNHSASSTRPQSRASRTSSRLSSVTQAEPVEEGAHGEVFKSSSESSLEEVILESPVTSRKKKTIRVTSTEMPSYTKKLMSGSCSDDEDKQELIKGSTEQTIRHRLESIGLAPTEDYTVSSDEEADRAVVPFIGWEASQPVNEEKENVSSVDPLPNVKVVSKATKLAEDKVVAINEPPREIPFIPSDSNFPKEVKNEKIEPPTLEAPPPSLETVDIGHLKDFVMKPAPEGVIIKCRITRQKGFYPTYYLHLDDDTVNSKRFLLAARKRKKSKSSYYIISIDQADLSKDGPDCVGKLKSNFVGTSFTVFDSGTNPSKVVNGNYNPREELAAVTYETNVLGFKGPRKMSVIIPAMTTHHERIAVKPLKESETLLERFKVGHMEDLLELKNKQPQWSNDSQAYVLNFHGRVTEASVKNFQLVHESSADYIVLQFGRVSSEIFTMDYSFPLNALQAFAISLSSFDSKLACE